MRLLSVGAQWKRKNIVIFVKNARWKKALFIYSFLNIFFSFILKLCSTKFMFLLGYEMTMSILLFKNL